jgi:hypothetical protein
MKATPELLKLVETAVAYHEEVAHGDVANTKENRERYERALTALRDAAYDFGARQGRDNHAVNTRVAPPSNAAEDQS